MGFNSKTVPLEQITAYRDRFRQEMNCQIIHDSIHSRPGWTLEYFLSADGVTVAYGSIAVSGPWKAKPTVYEFYVLPQHRSRIFDLFSVLLTASGAVSIETQSNDTLLTVMLHTFAHNIASESILFHDKLTTAHALPGAIFRSATPGDATQISSHE